ncbi:Os04g0645901 [Oryza sativa Japonica Group]|uniref:Os04g0645901 protein n=1 Tax=Oryza sativa subsp. japonica TaxID=39947 RepID=A0A0P0WFV6_ORYSJ|nr:hypothetical protein EE612_025906 [Oryza sativa]BAS91316.1 Os04g0645901 [Oryza sativa Japonica Group]
MAGRSSPELLALVLAAGLPHPVLGLGVGGEEVEVAPPVLLLELPRLARAHAAAFPRQPAAGLGRPGQRVLRRFALRRRLLLPAGACRVAVAPPVAWVVILLAIVFGARVEHV